MAYDPARKGSLGNRSLLSKYGGNPGSGPSARNKYAQGGAVKRADGGFVGPEEDDDEAMEMDAPDGEVAKPSLSRPGRKIKGEKKEKNGKTDINIIIMSGKDAPPGGPPMPPPMAGPPPMPPPGPPPGPPMMRADGGAVKKKASGLDVFSSKPGAGTAITASNKMRDRLKANDMYGPQPGDDPVTEHMKDSAGDARFARNMDLFGGTTMGALGVLTPEPIGKTLGLMGGAAGLGAAALQDKKVQQFDKGADMWSKTGLPGKPKK